MQPDYLKIPAKTRRQAMDWSLVLVSQGIDSILANEEPDSKWNLMVKPEDHARALESIRLYRLENRNWPWRRPLLKQSVVFDWACTAWTILIIFFFWATAQNSAIKSVGRMESPLVSAGEWWRVFTSLWLHADLGHLATNATFGFLLVGLALGRHGTGLGLLLVCLSGAAGNLFAGTLAEGPHRSLGASGMVMGAAGLLVIGSLEQLRSATRRVKPLLASVAGGVMLFVLLGLNPGSDVLAHLGGFLGGVGLGGIAAFFPRRTKSSAVDIISGLTFLVLVIWPWYLALVSRSE